MRGIFTEGASLRSYLALCSFKDRNDPDDLNWFFAIPLAVASPGGEGAVGSSDVQPLTVCLGDAGQSDSVWNASTATLTISSASTVTYTCAVPALITKQEGNFGAKIVGDIRKQDSSEVLNWVMSRFTIFDGVKMNWDPRGKLRPYVLLKSAGGTCLQFEISSPTSQSKLASSFVIPPSWTSAPDTYQIVSCKNITLCSTVPRNNSPFTIQKVFQEVVIDLIRAHVLMINEVNWDVENESYLTTAEEETSLVFGEIKVDG